MARKLIALFLTAVLLLPAVALGESTPLPFGLKLGMNTQETEAAFKADATLSKASPDKSSTDVGTVDYVFDDLSIPGTDEAASLTVEIDRNNSPQEDRLTSLSFQISPTGGSIAAFRQLLTSMTASLGAPDNDPFDADAVSQYVEWGTLDASWTKEDARVSLSLSRMFEENLTVQYSSRLNYDPADLAE